MAGAGKNGNTKKTGTVPGRPARGTTTGVPINVLLDLLGRKQALRILWELQGGTLTFRDLQSRCGGISPTVLNTRLAELREALIVAPNGGTGYELTADGRRLSAARAPLNAFARSWARRFGG